MTNARRKLVAKRFREMLDEGTHRKQALMEIGQQYGVSRRSVYNYCKEFSISTK